ncbi:hypothetical protein [Niabella ginsengisoli]|uniref:Uncharacterized protein n=1 Tax=Niabella ginsengisoli TaxID=522298 RepID=A0ABS9SQ88_9BACT|nr:hypothetical protein [Niabella ginsengisoli]MCH5600558.1 hypothetical protein [Niabella ginsengisoli]
MMKDNANASEKTTGTDDKGEFIFHLTQRAAATLYGKKDKYLSQVVEVSSANYDRHKTLFIKL